MSTPKFELRHMTPKNIRRRDVTKQEAAALAGAAILVIGVAAGIGIVAIRRARKKIQAGAIVEEPVEKIEA